MKNTRHYLQFLVSFMFCLTASMASAKTVTFESLLDEMVDRSTLANFPSPLYTCLQASSYDRDSTVADNSNDWFANKDTSQFLRSEKHGDREEWVMMDAKGPGAITRWWVTHKSGCKGSIRIYIDGAAEPVVTARVSGLVGGTALVGPPLPQRKTSPLLLPYTKNNEEARSNSPLSEVTARGRNLYLPIPYAKSCKVTFDRPNFQLNGIKNDMLYYQINYRTYAPGTKVESFNKSTIANSKAKIDKVQRTLLGPSSAPRSPDYVPTWARTVSGKCKPGETFTIPKFEGPRAICSISIKLKAKDLTQALRSTILKATFDGQQTIWCPLGDFFGSGVGLNPYQGWYRQVKKDGRMTCWWTMPFEESCSFAVENLGKEEISFQAEIAHYEWTWTDRSMHFHTTWRQERNLKTHKNKQLKFRKINHAFDWNFLEVDGQGVFVGDTLTLLNRSERWWGEGDEKIYVDGEKFPSHFGTGTEDYYGYAWCRPDFFESPFHAQPRAEGPKNFGNITNTRVRLLDDIPFTKSYKMDMEIWHWDTTTVDYAATTYWYGRPGAKANYGPMPTEAQQPVKYHTPR